MRAIILSSLLFFISSNVAAAGLNSNLSATFFIGAEVEQVHPQGFTSWHYYNGPSKFSGHYDWHIMAEIYGIIGSVLSQANSPYKVRDKYVTYLTVLKDGEVLLRFLNETNLNVPPSSQLAIEARLTNFVRSRILNSILTLSENLTQNHVDFLHNLGCPVNPVFIGRSVVSSPYSTVACFMLLNSTNWITRINVLRS